MTIPQLYYFTFRGYGEYIRLLLVDNKIEFEDNRFKYGGKEWEEAKKSMIFGQMPCLKVDGKELVQTGAIMRHLGRKYNLNGSTEEDATFLDMFFEGVRDVSNKYVSYIMMEDGTGEEIVKKTIPDCLEKLEKLFNIHTGDFIIGDSTSYADYLLFEELDAYHHLSGQILDKFPGLKNFWEKMWQRPNLKTYLEKRTSDGIWINPTAKGM